MEITIKAADGTEFYILKHLMESFAPDCGGTLRFGIDTAGQWLRILPDELLTDLQEKLVAFLDDEENNDSTAECIGVSILLRSLETGQQSVGGSHQMFLDDLVSLRLFASLEGLRRKGYVAITSPLRLVDGMNPELGLILTEGLKRAGHSTSLH